MRMSMLGVTKSTFLLSISAGVAMLTLWKICVYLKRIENVKKRALKDASTYIRDKAVIIVTSDEEWESVYTKLLKDLRHKRVLGLDCEWVGKNKVALLQLCTPFGLCVLIRLSMMKAPFPESLVSLLSDRSILKAGVAVVNDGKKLQLDYGFQVAGCVDLRHLLERVRGIFDCKARGLKGLASGIINVEISKDPGIRCGNWEAEKYSKAQIDYAATDAAVAVDIFVELVSAKLARFNEKQKPCLTPKTSEASGSPAGNDVGLSSAMIDEDSTENNFWKMTCTMCQGIVDVGYTSHSNNGSQVTVSSSKKQLKEGKEIYSTRKRPLWDNCRLQAPDGTTLCTCDKRKAQWYLDKGLADKVCDDPITVKLRFEPSNRPENERNYYLQEKANQCVVCGAEKDYVRKFVIPFEYKNALKDHSSHDVLLLCTSCHRQSCNHDSILRQQLGDECDAPVESGSYCKTVVDHDLQKVRSAGRALKLNRSTIPPERVKELEKLLLDFFGIDSLSDEVLERAAYIDARHTAENYTPHGKKVVRHMIMNGGLLAFQARWRQHFLDTMKPQYLPAFWSVDYIPEGWTKQGNVS